MTDEKYLSEALAGRLEKATGRTSDEVQAILAHVAPSSFTDEQGDLDDAKITAFAGTVKSTSGPSNYDPVASALSRQRMGGSGGGSPSVIQERREQVRDGMLPKKGRSE
jgi:hypothetical protein